MQVRTASPDDQQPIVDIYNHHVRSGFATFDVAQTSVAARSDWFGRFADTGPHQLVVAVEGAEVLGYACSNPYRDHPAFAETVELSVYVSPEQVGRGVGSALYSDLLERLRDEPIHRILAAIALPNDGSVALHRRFGFEEIGVFDEYARKGDRRISSVWMQRRW
ncbi:MAG: N-acetyltransferase family protein [Actinomycetota bacterium]